MVYMILIPYLIKGGIMTIKMFLDNGNTVYAVEPNNDMRQVAENSFESYVNFHSI